MTIPDWDRNKVVPPIRPGTTGDWGHLPDVRSPYRATLSEFVLRFAVSPQRVRLIRGLLDYRRDIHTNGIQRGFQWVNGSFLEYVEQRQYEPHEPNDIDVVTFYHIERGTNPDTKFLFSPENTKKFFDVDGYGVQLGPTLTKERTELIAYWHGMWSHRERDGMWKGYVVIDLDPSEDGPAGELLNSGTRQRRLL